MCTPETRAPRTYHEECPSRHLFATSSRTKFQRTEEEYSLKRTDQQLLVINLPGFSCYTIVESITDNWTICILPPWLNTERRRCQRLGTNVCEVTDAKRFDKPIAFENYRTPLCKDGLFHAPFWQFGMLWHKASWQ